MKTSTHSYPWTSLTLILVFTKRKEAFQDESVPDGLELKSGSKLFLIPCCTLALRLHPAQAKNSGCPGILAWWIEVRGAQDSGKAGLPLSCVSIPSFSLSVVDTWDHSRNTAELWCWFVRALENGMKAQFSTRHAARQGGDEGRCSQWAHTHKGNTITSEPD